MSEKVERSCPAHRELASRQSLPNQRAPSGCEAIGLLGILGSALVVLRTHVFTGLGSVGRIRMIRLGGDAEGEQAESDDGS